MRNSVLMTVYDREPLVLKNVLAAIRKNDLSDTEIIVVDDGSSIDYTDFRLAHFGWGRWLKVNTITDRPGTYNIDGYNNPAYAWNCAIDAATGDNLIFLSSDCIMQPDAIKKATRNTRNTLWMPRVVDMDTGHEWLGRQRVYPMGWMSCIHRKHVKPYDENYLKGIDFDDNDFIATLALSVGSITIDLSCMLFHQSHTRVAYSDNLEGHKINRSYIEKKWGGIPWANYEKDPISKRAGQTGSELRLSVKMKEQKVTA